MVPGTPGYTARIPRPPCYQCGDDHVPNMQYSHEWMAEPVQVHDEPVSASAIMRRPAPAVFDTQVAASLPSHRVALYVGRGDTYVVAVEQAPDWDAEQTFKVQPELVLPLIQMARALGVKISDKTGGDLLMLEQEYGGSKPQADHDRGAQGAGDHQPRRQRSGANRPKADQPGEDQQEPG